MAEADAVRHRRRLLDALGAAIAAALMFGAVPAVLILIVGNPLRGGLGHSWRPESRDALCVLVLAAWVAWAFCCAQLVRGVAVHVRRGTVGLPAGASVMDRLAGRIALGILALSSVGAPLALTSAAGAEPASGAHATMATQTTDTLATKTTDTVTTLPADAMTTDTVTMVDSRQPPLDASMQLIHVVRPGETLWGIADRYAGDGADWTSIARLNLGLDMADGERFVDPDHIRAGWRLRLAPGSSRGSHGEHLDAARDGSDHLPELIALGLGSVACAGLARRTRRRREVMRESAVPWGPVSDDAVDTAALLGRFEGVPALESFEAANRMLGRALSWALDRPATALDHPPNKIRAVCVGPEGVAFVLALPDRDAPEGFDLSADGTRWVVPHDRLDMVEEFYPALPIALPVGTDDAGTWLVALGPGDVLPVLGESADSLCRAARAGQVAWAWSDLVVVTEDPTDPGLERAEHALFFGDPSALDPRRRASTAVVSSAPVAPTDLTVLVDRHGATIHPIGRVVRPQLLGIETSRAIEELAAQGSGLQGLGSQGLGSQGLGSEGVGSEGLGSQDPSAPERRRDPGPTLAMPDPEYPGDQYGPGSSALFPGTVDVRLLTASPRLEGLREELPPNRARRAVELVAYLALHHPDAVTSDRLRTRVLGSSDADAASKTLFNTAHAARRAMGADQHGEALFPSATRVGLYQVSEHVTVDVHRAAALVEEGKRTDDPELAMAYLRAALELVEGEPLAHALAGYSWWEAEGHGARVAAVLVDAACRLARLASAAGLFELARRGLDRARLVEPYSEVLSRAAMEVAAAEGDAERLRLEWLDCQRRVDALDPGSSPSRRTETLYGELSSRVLVDVTGPALADGD